MLMGYKWMLQMYVKVAMQMKPNRSLVLALQETLKRRLEERGPLRVVSIV